MLKMGVVNVDGSQLMGYMPEGITYGDLVKVFGEPNRDVSENYKVDVEWFGTIHGEAFTIYNYKTGRSYLKDQGKDVEQLVGTNWHIGGFNKIVMEKLVNYLRARMNLKKKGGK